MLREEEKYIYYVQINTRMTVGELHVIFMRLVYPPKEGNGISFT